MSPQSSPSQGGQIFIDESKAKDYLLVGAIIQPTELAAARKAACKLILPGQYRVHMFKESEQRKKIILASISAIGAEVLIYRADKTQGTETLRRTWCLDSLVDDALAERRAEIILELDSSTVRQDQSEILRKLKSVGAENRLAYRHATAASEPLLLIPDAIGWAWARGGDWRKRVSSLVSVHNVRSN